MQTLKTYIKESTEGRMFGLAGPSMSGVRQNIMLLITGVKMPKSKCGLTVVKKTIADYAGIRDYTCTADRDSKIFDWVQL